MMSEEEGEEEEPLVEETPAMMMMMIDASIRTDAPAANAADVVVANHQCWKPFANLNRP
jgi:hypothetical protein